MTILSAQSIRDHVSLYDSFDKKTRGIQISPFIPEAKQFKGMSYGLTAAGYDLRVGSLGKSPVTGSPISSKHLKPGAFCLVASLERIYLPFHIQAIVHDKSSWARQGLALQNTVIEPGWGGYITLELSNHGEKTIHIMTGMPIAQLVFHYLDFPTERPYKGKYQNQGSAPQEAIEAPDDSGSIATDYLPITHYPLVDDAVCMVCGGNLYATPSGNACVQGHGF